MLARLATLDADAVVLDLEDGVAPADKSAARDGIRAAAAGEARRDWPPWMLRVNSPRTPWHADDLALARELAAPRVVLPKAEDPTEVAGIARRAEAWGAKIGLMVETARGVGRLRELAGAHPAVDLLVHGAADLRLSLGARPGGGRAWERHALAEIVLAARMHGCWAIDAVYFRFRDEAGLRREAAEARELGFDGKSCIHPTQIAPIHDVFSSTQEELAWAAAVRRAWSEQNGEAQGVIVLDGEMIEALHLDLAERIAAHAPDRRDRGSSSDPSL